jgi:2-oxoisovalerate dehydrogenase E1 component beta subunit
MSEQKLSLLEAVNLALHRAMAEDENVVVLGEDIGVNGGVFRATLGLREAFGFKRVIDTPLAETMIAGLAVGMAAQGLKPVMEIQFMGFIYPALDHLVSHASRLRNRTRGRLTCPMVLRTPMGAGIRAPGTTARAPRRCSPRCPACAWSCRRRRRGPMACCWRPSTTPTR